MPNRAALDLAFASHLANVAFLAFMAVAGPVVSQLDHGSQIVWGFFLILPARVGVLIASLVSLVGNVVHWRRRDVHVTAAFLAVLWGSLWLAGAYALAALCAGLRWFRAERPSVRVETA